MMTVNINKFDSNTTVGDMLCTYFNVKTNNEVLNVLADWNYSMLDFWANVVDIKKELLFDIIEASLNNKADYKVKDHIVFLTIGFGVTLKLDFDCEE